MLCVTYELAVVKGNIFYFAVVGGQGDDFDANVGGGGLPRLASPRLP